jgi:isoprenylcysteine carboxyl methyltransferase (ICMT) family protein YpbQ
LFKDSIKLPFIYFLSTTVWQMIDNRQVQWTDNIMICFFMFLLLMLYNWSKVPYKWKQDKVEKD